MFRYITQLKTLFTKTVNIAVATILVLGIFASTIPLSSFAQSTKNFSIVINTKYTVDDKAQMSLIEERIITNNSESSYLTKTNSEKFYITTYRKQASDNRKWELIEMAKQSAVVKIDGKIVVPTFTKQSFGYEVKVNYPKDLYKGDTLKVEFEIKNYELVQKVGNIYNVFLPSISPNYAEIQKTYNFSYNTSINIDKKLGPINFSSNNSNPIANDKYYIYKFTLEELIKKFAWIQIGDRQIWKFKLTEQIPPTEQKIGNLTKYEVIIPTDDKTQQQKVYYESFNPVPASIEEDESGNLKATYYLSSSTSEITIDGYSLLDQTEASNLQSKPFDLGNYLTEQKYWEVNNQLIQQTAKDLSKSDSKEKVLQDTYNFVVSKVDYDNLKLGVDNVRQGAVATLEKGSGVCMEYSDLLITLLRAEGIPARAVFGYGFDQNKTGTEAEAHQWVQAYIEGKGWLSIDPTWGSTTRTFIGSDFDHFSWYVSVKDVNDPPTATRGGISESTGDFTGPEITITPVETIDKLSLMDKAKLLSKYKPTKEQQFINNARTYVNFQNILYVIAITLGITLILNIFSSIKKSFQKTVN